MSKFSSGLLDLCIAFILEQLKAHGERSCNSDVTPFFLGVNGVQGIGKTFLVRRSPELPIMFSTLDLLQSSSI